MRIHTRLKPNGLHWNCNPVGSQPESQIWGIRIQICFPSFLNWNLDLFVKIRIFLDLIPKDFLRLVLSFKKPGLSFGLKSNLQNFGIEMEIHFYRPGIKTKYDIQFYNIRISNKISFNFLPDFLYLIAFLRLEVLYIVKTLTATIFLTLDHC